ncbi:MAG: hypothetical protein IT385_01630 [Deltaproteobacteria bacterium]|nr:hypothetical protein [Deltaproteobacteria bacterium]
MSLIQGPPGTGKTTVIAEICLRTALAGQRVLIASQTNLAVDNALARLADQPAVRRLRLGDPDRVDEEFKDFLATHVIEHWFRAVAENCGKQQDATEAAMKDARHRSDAVDRMDGIALACAERTQQLARAATKCSQLRPELDAVGDARQAAAARRDASRDRLALWRELELWATIAGSLPTRLASLGQAIDIDELGQMDRDSERLPQIEGLLDALESVRRVGDGGEGNEELRQLRRRKQELDDAETDAELRELGEVNKRIKGLQGEGWSKATGALSRAAKAVYGPSLTPEIGRIVDALQRGSETAEALADAIKAARALRQAAERARHKRERFAKRCVQMTASTADQIESEERALEDADAMEKRTREALEQARLDREELGRSLDALSAEWKELWTMFAPGERAPAPTTKAAAEARHRFEAEEAEKAAERRRAERWSPIQHEWRARLAKISDSDREQIEGLYVRHANVVGMTTNEAGKKQTWQNDNFRPFDVVIIDEVSKATPPELLLPMLLGEKVILVGDHRQLPPMFRERDASFGEAGAEGEVSQDDISKYRRMVTASLFEELFDQADDRIKATLWTQYRMHPDIMTAVNQFYDGRLEAGPDELTLSARRRHHLRIPDRTGGVLLDEGQHLLWIDSSTDAAGRRSFEEQSGTSKVNDLEVKLVVETVLSLGRALAERGFRGDREVLVSPDHAGAPLREVIARLCPDLPNETIDELFEERRVRVGGRSRPPQEPARSGETILLQARREVGVISFYGAQLKALRDELTEARRLAPDAFVGIDLRTNTVDRFQGMEKSIIVASLVRSTKGHLGEFVREYQRINVGLSRAQRLLVIVGAIDTWKHAQVPLPPIAGGPAEDKPVYANILDHVRIRGGRRTARQLLAS